MEEKILIEKFKEISKKGWIKGVSNNIGSGGLTFEKELGKEPDSTFFPDYRGIELKCCSRFSTYPLNLFTIMFDGPSLTETQRITDLYGYTDTDFPDKNVLFADLNYKHKTLLKSEYKMGLDYNEKEKRIYVCVYDINDNIIEKKSYIELESIYNHISIKLNKMAIIYNSKRVIDNNLYFRFYKIEIFQIRSYQKFIDMIINGKIDISLISRISKSGPRKGQYKNKNLVFKIEKEYINELFKIKYSYDSDKRSYKK